MKLQELFTDIVNEMQLISDKQANAIKNSQTIKAISPTNTKRTILNAIKYPLIDKTAKLKLIDEGPGSFTIRDSQMFYRLHRISPYNYDVSFGFNRGESYRLEAGKISKEDIFSNLKTLIYITMKYLKKSKMAFSFSPIEGQRDDELSADDFVLSRIQFAPFYDDLEDEYNKHDKKKLLYNVIQKAVGKKYQSGSNVDADINALFDTFPKPVQKYRTDVLDWFKQASKFNRISSIRERMYSSLLNKLGKDVKYNKQKAYYSFTVSLDDL